MTDLSKRFQTVKGKRFAKVLNDRFAELREHIKTNTADGVRNQWMLANEMNNDKIDGYLEGVKVSDELAQSFRTPNLDALNAFIDRTENGMNLSKRVWKMTKGKQKEIESLISQGVLEGKSARTLSKELKGYVKGKPIRYQGTLIKGANLNYQAIRLAATEMNMAFRTADYLQNSRLPFVTGVTVELSAAHPMDDICDSLAGHYPKGFNFTGWHPLCICFATWDTLPKEEFAKYIETGNIDQRRFTTAIPQRAQRYIKKNGERLLGYKNTPYFLRDNFTDKLVLKDVVQTPIMETPVPMTPTWTPAKTIEEAEQWAKNNGIAENILYSGSRTWGGKLSKTKAVEKFNAVNKEINAFQNRANIKLPKVENMYITNSGRGRASSNTITFANEWDSKTWANIKAWEKRELEAGRISKWDMSEAESHIATNVRHEFAHILDIKQNITQRGFTSDWSKVTTKIAKEHKFFSKNISDYAGKNGREYFAEAFSHYTSPLYGTKEVSKFPKELEDFLETILDTMRIK
jgi:hypothetical protein